MRTKLGAGTALLLGVLTLPLVPTPAAATSCATVPASAAALLRGTPVLGRDRLFDAYDYALVGTVTAVHPHSVRSTAPGTYPQAQDVDVDVIGAFNRASTPARVTLQMRDRGEMLGYPFDVGQKYFIAVKNDEVGLCSPTQPLTRVDADAGRAVDALRAAALVGGAAVALPSGTTTVPAGPATPTPRPAGVPSTALVGGVSAAAAAGLLAAIVGVRSRRRRGTGEDVAG